MSVNSRTFSYRGHKGKVEQIADGSFVGYIEGFKAYSSFKAHNIEELEIQFKAQVNRFYEACNCLGVKPELIDKAKGYQWIYVLVIISALIIMGGALFVFLYHFPYGEPISADAKKILIDINWFEAISSFFNNFTAPLLTFLSFSALLYTIHLQNETHKISVRTLDLSAKELSETTKANIEQAKALNIQAKEAKSALSEQKKLTEQQSSLAQRQQFDSMFYSLFSEHNRLLETIKDNKIFSLKQSPNNREEYIKHIMQDTSLCRYFRTLYQLLKFIAKHHPENLERSFSIEALSGIPKEDEKTYASLVRSTIPDHVLLYLAVNCSNGAETGHSYHKYYLLVCRYSLLEHLKLGENFSYETRSMLGNVNKWAVQKPNVYLEILAIYPPLAWGIHDELTHIYAEQFNIIKELMNKEPLLQDSQVDKWMKESNQDNSQHLDTTT